MNLIFQRLDVHKFWVSFRVRFCQGTAGSCLEVRIVKMISTSSLEIRVLGWLSGESHS